MHFAVDVYKQKLTAAERDHGNHFVFEVTLRNVLSKVQLKAAAEAKDGQLENARIERGMLFNLIYFFFTNQLLEALLSDVHASKEEIDRQAREIGETFQILI